MCNFEITISKGNLLNKVEKYKFLTKSEIQKTIASGDDGVEETLLPIPNRTVKLYSVNGTAWVTVWESRTLPGNIRIFSSVGQSNRLITGRSGVRVPEGPPFLGVQLSWESTCLARKGSRVRLPLPPPKATNYFVAFFYCVPSVGNNLIMKVIGRYYVGQNR